MNYEENRKEETVNTSDNFNKIKLTLIYGKKKKGSNC